MIDVPPYHDRFNAALARHWRPYFGILAIVMIITCLVGLPSFSERPLDVAALAYVAGVIALWGAVFFAAIVGLVAIRKTVD